MIEIFRQIDRKLSVDFFKTGQQQLHFLTTNMDACRSSLIILKDSVGKMGAVRILEAMNAREELRVLPKIVWGDMSVARVQQLKAAGATDCLKISSQPSEVKKILTQMLSYAGIAGQRQGVTGNDKVSGAAH